MIEAHVSMPEEFLDGADVIPGFKEMGRKGVPERFDIMLHLIDKH